MEGTVLLLPHQERFLQTPNNFPDIRWHFLLAGYGAGKTRSLAIAALRIIAELDGDKDDGGLYAKIAVAGYTYAHLEQTFMIDFKAYLDGSKTPYHEDTKDHIITVGTVQVMFLQLSEPGKIFGQSIYCLVGNTKCLTKSVNGTILYKKLKNICVGDIVLTRAGWREVQAVMNNGKKRVTAKAGLIGTPDHRIPTVWQRNIQLQDADRGTYFGVSKRKVRIWQELNQKLEVLKQTLLTLTVCDTTDTQTVLGTIEAVTIGVRAINRCIVLYGKRLMGQFLRDASYITKTGTLLTTLLKILSACQKVSTAHIMEKNTAVMSLLRLKLRLCAMYAGHILKGLQDTVSISPALSTVGTSHSVLYSAISELLTMCRKYSSENQLDTKSLVSTVAQCSALLRQQLDFALKSAETLILGERERPQFKKTGTTLLPVPFVEKSSSLVTGVVDFARSAVLTFTGGIRTVYDITVDDCHEFATDSCFVHNCALADEIDELEEDTMIEAMKSLSQRVRQIMPNHRPPYIMAASTAQGMKGFYRLYSSYRKNGVGFVLTRARTQDNWYLPKDYIEDLWKNFTETERRVYMEGEFLTVTQGRVIPGFDWDKNYDSASDMDLELVPGERVYIGMDFNCLVGDTLILTSRGNVPIKDVKVGDYVLTRKGYRKVLTSVSRGVKIVYNFNRLTGTKDHVAITPQGDVELCRAQNFYCLTEQSIKELQQLSRVQENLNTLKQFYTTGTYGDAGLTVPMTTLEAILQATERSCISTSIRSSMVKCLRVSKSTTKTAAMTTDLKVLCACLPQLIQSCIREAVRATSEKKHGNIPQIKLWSGISLRTVKSITRKLLKAHGVEESSVVLYAASIVARILRLASERLNAARYAGKNIPKNLKEQAIREAVKVVQQSVMLELREFVLSAEKLLSEQLQRSIAKNIKVIGSVPATNEREAEVFDIEVEGEHEFFANGILVHNCSYNRASAWVSREGRMHCVKYYDFPDPSESAKVFRYDFPYQDIFWLPDVTSKDLYPQYARELRKYGIHIIHRSKSPLVEDSCFLLSKMCLQGRLIIHSRAVEVADAFATASRDKNNKIPKGVGPSSPIHAIDGARYACSYMALVLPEYRDVRTGLMQHLASFRRSLEEPEGTNPVQYKGAGYTQLEGEAFL